MSAETNTTSAGAGVSFEAGEDGAVLIVDGVHGSLVVFLAVFFLVLVYCLGVLVGIGVGQTRPRQRPGKSQAMMRQ